MKTVKKMNVNKSCLFETSKRKKWCLDWWRQQEQRFHLLKSVTIVGTFLDNIQNKKD